MVSHNTLALISYSYKTLDKFVSQSLLVFSGKDAMEIAWSNRSYWRKVSSGDGKWKAEFWQIKTKD